MVSYELFYVDCGYVQLSKHRFNIYEKALNYINKIIRIYDKQFTKNGNVLGDNIIDINKKVRAESLQFDYYKKLLKEDEQIFANYFFLVSFNGHKEYFSKLKDVTEKKNILSNFKVIESYTKCDINDLIHAYQNDDLSYMKKLDYYFENNRYDMQSKLLEISKSIKINLYDNNL